MILTTFASALLLFSATAFAAPEGTVVVATQTDGFVDAAATIVMTEEVAIHSEPSDNSSVIATLPAGTSLARVAVNPESGWVRISYNGQICYVWHEYVQLAQSAVTEQADDTYVQAVGNMNVRSEPGQEGINIGTFSDGQVAHRVAICSNGWSKIEFNGGYGYVGGSLTATTAPETVAQTETPVETVPQTEAIAETPAETQEASVPSEAETQEVAVSSEAETQSEAVEASSVSEESTASDRTQSSEAAEASENQEEVTESAEDSAQTSESTDSTASVVTSDPNQSGNTDSGKQISVWKMIFFVFIVLLIINTVILVATVVKKDGHAGADEDDDMEDEDEDDDSTPKQ